LRIVEKTYKPASPEALAALLEKLGSSLDERFAKLGSSLAVHVASTTSTQKKAS
jgi:hypothetical protein